MKQTVYFLLLCVAGVLFSCMEDDVSKPSFTDDNSTKIWAREFDPRTEPKVLSTLKRFVPEGKLSINNSLARGGIESLYVDSTTVVEVIQQDGTKRYTFRLLSETPVNDFYNLIVEDTGSVFM